MKREKQMILNKKRLIRCMDIIFWTIIITRVIIEFRTALSKGSVSFDGLTAETMEYFGTKEYLTLACSAVLMFLFYVVIAQLKLFYLTIPYIGVKIAYKKFSKERLDKTDSKSEHYYREIISQYSPAVLSYIDDFKLEDKDIVTTVMALELKGKIKIENEISVIDNNEDDLEENEKYIFDHIKNKQLKNINAIDFQSSVMRDCKKNGFLEEKNDIKRKIVRNIVILVFIYILIKSGIGFSIIDKLPENEFIVLLIMAGMLIGFLAMIILPFVAMVYIFSYLSMNAVNPYKRSKNGKQINLKLKGLKNYIKDYSLLDEKKYSDLLMWEDYLIYSVMFGQNDKVVKEIMEKI